MTDTTHASLARFAAQSSADRIAEETRAFADAAADDVRSVVRALAAFDALPGGSLTLAERALLTELQRRCEDTWAKAETTALDAEAASRGPRGNPRRKDLG